MASEEVSKLLTHLQKLKDTKMGEGSEEETEAEKLKRELEEGVAEKEAAAIETAALAETKEALTPTSVAELPPEKVEEPKPVEQPVAAVTESVEKPVTEQQTIEPKEEVQQLTQEQKQEIVQRQVLAEVEALNNDGVFRHALLDKLNSIENHLHVLAISAVKLSNLEINEDGKEENNINKVN